MNIGYALASATAIWLATRTIKGVIQWFDLVAAFVGLATFLFASGQIGGNGQVWLVTPADWVNCSVLSLDMAGFCGLTLLILHVLCVGAINGISRRPPL